MMDVNISAFVVDNSYLIECIDNPNEFPLFFDFDIKKYTPHLLLYELSNVLLGKIKKNVIDAHRAYDDIIDRVVKMLHFVDYPKNENAIDIFRNAQKYNLTFYDAAYLQLAIDKTLPLATYDKQLIYAAEQEGLQLLC